MTGLVDKNGRAISSAMFKKEDPPKLGNAFAPWAGREIENMMNTPGGSMVQFDLSKLRLEDYRVMRDHYQVNASLAVLSFLQHQADWTIECSDKKIADACTEQLNSMWTQLNRSLGTANWAGFSPNALDWENVKETGRTEITKVKDLLPEECEVNWKEEEGWAPPGRVKPKYKIYDGIHYAPQRGWPIPVENSFWYPLLMENGNYYGRKLLRPAFQSWYFSILIHLFANRYFERFGEPVPIGRAPFDEDIEVVGPNGQTGKINSQAYMLKILQDLRNRSVVTLPNDRVQVGSNGQMAFEYEIEYLESQMRGADFERYLTRLDEEVSIGLFTPILLLRTADVGSYNLGQGHMQVYLWMMNAMNDDRALYIDKYILRKFVNYNFSVNAPSAKIKFRKLGNTDTDLIKQVLVALISGGTAKPNLEELGKLAGLSLTQVKQTIAPDPAATDPATDAGQGDTGTGNADKSTSSLTSAASVLKEIVNRVRPQVQKAYSDNTYGPGFKLNMGFKNRFEAKLRDDDVLNSVEMTKRFYARMDAWVEDVTGLGKSVFSGTDTFMDAFTQTLERQFAEVETHATKNW